MRQLINRVLTLLHSMENSDMANVSKLRQFINGIINIVWLILLGTAMVIIAKIIYNYLKERGEKNDSKEGTQKVPTKEKRPIDTGFQEKLKVLLDSKGLDADIPDDMIIALNISTERFQKEGESYVKKNVVSLLKQVDNLKNSEGLEERHKDRCNELSEKLKGYISEWKEKLEGRLVIIKDCSCLKKEIEPMLSLLNQELKSLNIDLIKADDAENQNIENIIKPFSTESSLSVFSEFMEAEVAIGAIKLCNRVLSLIDDEMTSWDQIKTLLT